MTRQEQVRYSQHTGMKMPLWRYGARGAVLLYLPSSGGDHREFERFGMHLEAEPWIEAGQVQCFSVDGRGSQTLFDPGLAPSQRIAGYAATERYLSAELLPWLLELTGRPRLQIVGSSYGAFAGANLLFKHHRHVDLVCGLGGVYEMWHRLDGHHDDDVYFHTPLEYLPHLEEHGILGAIRSTRGISLYAAADDPWLPQTHQLESVLRDKRLPYRTMVWASPADHHERWWRLQLHHFLEATFGTPG